MSDESVVDTKQKGLSEKKIAQVLLIHLRNLGYKATTELVLNSKHFDIQQLTGKDV